MHHIPTTVPVSHSGGDLLMTPQLLHQAPHPGPLVSVLATQLYHRFVDKLISRGCEGSIWSRQAPIYAPSLGGSRGLRKCYRWRFQDTTVEGGFEAITWGDKSQHVPGGSAGFDVGGLGRLQLKGDLRWF